MYKIKKRIEVGHYKQIGGSVDIILTFDNIMDTSLYEKLIDSLDHSLITDNSIMLNYSERFFLLNKCRNLLTDIHDILSYFIYNREVKNIEIEVNNKLYAAPPSILLDNSVLKYNIKG